MSVEFVQERPPPKIAQQVPRQIVSMPDQTKETNDPAHDSRLLAEKNFVTKEEKIHRGDDPQAGPVAGKSQPPQKASRPVEEQRSKQQTAPPKLKQLALDRETLLNDFAMRTPSASDDSPTRKEQNARNNSPYRAFSRPTGSGAAFLGTSGMPDYLPNLPDGDITLLNTKANLFAVFVRRVATQVFAQLRLSGWENLRPADINAIGDVVTVRAVLALDGKLLKVQIESSSGSPRFDETVRKAAEVGAKDPNPPKEAVAEDGTIHFIFQSRSWVQYAPQGRTGAPTERRWLLLGTGLE